MKEKPVENRFLVDFDGTISQTRFNEYNGVYEMGPLVPGMKEAINTCSLNHEIVIFTSRPRKEWPKVTQYLADNGVVFHRVMKKPLGIAYIDDRNMKPKEFIDSYTEAPDDGTYDSSGNKL